MVRKIAEWFGLITLSLAAVFVVVAGTTGAVLACAALAACVVGLVLVFAGTRGTP